ncbi:MAG: ORF6N domain-containing protein [Flavobacterium sp.]|nr:ORF6N domain-containing protein [Flavobacterium sp.]
MHIIQSIENRIHTIRGESVMLDGDLALLYEIETKLVNLGVVRHAMARLHNFNGDQNTRHNNTANASQKQKSCKAYTRANAICSTFVFAPTPMPTHHLKQIK